MLLTRALRRFFARSGTAEVLRALGQQLMEQADALESGAESEMGSGEYELDDRD